MNKRLSIVIVTYNSEHEIGPCLTALSGFDPDTIEIVVIDNASVDGTPAYLQAQYGSNPQYRLVFNQKNTGFAEGATQGIALASAPVVLSINPDTTASVSGIMQMLAYFEQHPEIGILGPRIVDEHGTPQESFGEELTPWMEITGKFLYSKYMEIIPFIKRWKQQKLNSSEITEVGWVGGACFMMRKDVYLKIGGIDQQFFLSHGDLIDLSKRVRDLGYKNIVFAPVSIVHTGSKSVAHDRDAALRTSYIGTLYYFQKYHGPITLFLAKVVYVCSSLVKACISFPISLFRRNPYRMIAKAHFNNAMRIISGRLGKIA